MWQPTSKLYNKAHKDLKICCLQCCIYKGLFTFSFIFYRHVDVVRALLKAGADVKIKNSKGLEVFDLALLAGMPEITRLLVAGGE